MELDTRTRRRKMKSKFVQKKIRLAPKCRKKEHNVSVKNDEKKEAIACSEEITENWLHFREKNRHAFLNK